MYLDKPLYLTAASLWRLGGAPHQCAGDARGAVSETVHLPVGVSRGTAVIDEQGAFAPRALRRA